MVRRKSEPKKKSAPKNKGGRPKIQIDAQQVEQLAAMHCTNEDIAAFFGCSRHTIWRGFATNLALGKHKGRTKLRQLQWKSAEAGNVQMLIWLGKQYLGQKEKAETEVPEGIDVVITYADKKKSENKEVIKDGG